MYNNNNPFIIYKRSNNLGLSSSNLTLLIILGKLSLEKYSNKF